MIASFSIIPIGVGVELGRHIAEVITLVEASGLDYRLGAMHTTVEGEREEVISLIMECHARMRQSAPRVVTSITIDDREGAKGRIEGKVTAVEEILGRRLKHE